MRQIARLGLAAPRAGEGFDYPPEAADHRPDRIDAAEAGDEQRTVERARAWLVAFILDDSLPFDTGHEDRTAGGLALAFAVDRRQLGVELVELALGDNV